VTSPGAISSGTWLATAPRNAGLQHGVGVVAPVDGDGQQDAEEHDRRHRHGEDRQEMRRLIAVHATRAHRCTSATPATGPARSCTGAHPVVPLATNFALCSRPLEARKRRRIESGEGMIEMIPAARQ
jgi:hypothetical protein